MHCGMTVEIHGALAAHPWLDGLDQADFRESVLDLAVERTDAYGWHAPYGWKTSSGKKRFHLPDRWLDCEKGGDWAGDDQPRRLAWMRADIPEDARHPRLPVLPMTRVLVDALGRVGTVGLAALRTYLPLQITAGDAEGDWEDMRDWFALADPGGAVDVLVTVSAAPSSAWRRESTTRVRDAVRERVGGAADVRDPSPEAGARQPAGVEERPLVEGARAVVRFGCRAREWSPEVAVWLVEATGDALRATGHTLPVVVTAARVSSS